MSCHEDRIAAHKAVAKDVFPQLTEEQLEAVWALWAYHSPKAHRQDHYDAVCGYLTTECGVPHIDEARRLITALHRYDLCLF